MKSRVIKIFSLVFDRKIQKNENLIYGKTEDWDSLKHIEIILSVEEEFDIHFTKKDINELTSLNDIVDMVESKIEK